MWDVWRHRPGQDGRSAGRIRLHPRDATAALAQLRSDPLPTGDEALDAPLAAFPSWFMRITCDRCGQERMLNEAHAAQRAMPIREIVEKMRHDGCGGRPGRVELLTASRPRAADRYGASC